VDNDPPRRWIPLGDICCGLLWPRPPLRAMMPPFALAPPASAGIVRASRRDAGSSALIVTD